MKRCARDLVAQEEKEPEAEKETPAVDAEKSKEEAKVEDAKVCGEDDEKEKKEGGGAASSAAGGNRDARVHALRRLR